MGFNTDYGFALRTSRPEDKSKQVDWDRHHLSKEDEEWLSRLEPRMKRRAELQESLAEHRREGNTERIAHYEERLSRMNEFIGTYESLYETLLRNQRRSKTSGAEYTAVIDAEGHVVFGEAPEKFNGDNMGRMLEYLKEKLPSLEGYVSSHSDYDGCGPCDYWIIDAEGVHHHKFEGVHAAVGRQLAKQAKKKKARAIEKPSKEKKAERDLYRQFVSRHNAMVKAMNTKYADCAAAHEAEMDARNEQYKAYLDIMHKHAMKLMGGKKGQRYQQYDAEVKAAIEKHNREHPMPKPQHKRKHEFARMAGGLSEYENDGTSDSDDAEETEEAEDMDTLDTYAAAAVDSDSSQEADGFDDELPAPEALPPPPKARAIAKTSPPPAKVAKTDKQPAAKPAPKPVAKYADVSRPKGGKAAVQPAKPKAAQPAAPAKAPVLMKLKMTPRK